MFIMENNVQNIFSLSSSPSSESIRVVHWGYLANIYVRFQ